MKHHKLGFLVIFASSLVMLSTPAIHAAEYDILATITVGTSPRAIAFDSANNRMYVANYDSYDVSVISTATNTVIKTITVGTSPRAIAFDSANNRMYVANLGDASNSVSVISTATNTVIKTITVGSFPEGIAFDSANNRMYVANHGSNTVSVIRTSDNTVIDTIDVGSPDGIAFDSANNRMYVANSGDASNSVFVISTATNTVIKTITVGTNPQGIAFDSANNRMYVANNNLGNADTVSVISTATNAVIGTPIGVGNGPRTIAFDSANNRMYVVNSDSNDVSVISTATNTVIDTIYVGKNHPNGIAFDSANNRMYMTNSGANTVYVIDAGKPTKSAPAYEPEPTKCDTGTIFDEKTQTCIVPSDRTEFLKTYDPDGKKDPQNYINRYLNEPKYKAWFDKNWGSKYKNIYEAVGLPEPIKLQINKITCGLGTVSKNGLCIPDKNYKKPLSNTNPTERNSVTLMKKADAYFDYGWYDKAQKYYDDVLKLEPNNQNAIKGKNAAYNEKRDILFRLSIANLNSKPDDKLIAAAELTQLSDDLLRIHRISDAVKICNDAEKLDHRFPLQCKLHIAIVLGKFDEAQKYLKQLVDLFETSVDPFTVSDSQVLNVKRLEWTEKSLILYHLKKYDQLISYMDEYLSTTNQQQTLDSYLIKGLIYEKSGDNKKANYYLNIFFKYAGVAQQDRIDVTKAYYYSEFFQDYQKAKFYADKLSDDEFFAFKLDIAEHINSKTYRLPIR